MPTEAQRQQALLAALRTPCPPPGPLAPTHPAHALLRDHGWEPDAMGLRAYQLNAQAHATQVLQQTFPTVLAMVGEEALSHLAQRCWQHHPPTSGDLGQWRSHLPDELAASEALQAWPWLADVARLDDARHQCAQAANAELDADSLQRLGDTAPTRLRLRLKPGTQLLSSRWPAGAFWRAHHLPEAAQESAIAQAVAQAKACAEPADASPRHHTLVWRHGWQVHTHDLAATDDAVGAAQLAWMHALLQTPPLTLDQALAAAGPDFDVTEWLAQALREGWLWHLQVEPN